MKKVEDIDAEIARLQAERIEAVGREEQRKRYKHYTEASELLDRVIADMLRLEEIGYLPPKLAESLVNNEGKFAPGKFIKKGRAPANPDAKRHD